MIADEVLRELGAEHRQFRSVRQALLWYRDELARRLRSTRQGFEVGAGPCSVAEQDERAATFAAIAQCLRARTSDDEEESAAMRGECVTWLIASYEARWGDVTWLADECDLSRWAFGRRCARTERYLRERLRLVGLV